MRGGMGSRDGMHPGIMGGHGMGEYNSVGDHGLGHQTEDLDPMEQLAVLQDLADQGYPVALDVLGELAMTGILNEIMGAYDHMMGGHPQGGRHGMGGGW
jgi:hypothetical protein